MPKQTRMFSNRYVPVNGITASHLDWTDGFVEFVQTPITRRTIVKAPIVATAIAYSYPALTADNAMQERLLLSINDERTEVTVSLWYENGDKGEGAGKLAAPPSSHVWKLTRHAFGPDARFHLFPDVRARKASGVVTGQVLTVANVQLGRSGRCEVEFHFTRKEPGANWALAAWTNLWGSGKRDQKSLAGKVGLANFIAGTKALHWMETNRDRTANSLTRIFNDLVQVGTQAKLGPLDVRLSRNLVWSISSSRPAQFWVVAPEVVADGVCLARATRQDSEDGKVEVIGIPVRARARSANGQELAAQAMEAGSQTEVERCAELAETLFSPANMADVEFHILDLVDKKHPEIDTTVLFNGREGPANCGLRAFEIDKVEGNSKSLRRYRCEAVIAGTWDISVFHGTDAPANLAAGPFRDITGVIKRTKTVRFRQHRDREKIVDTAEEFSFAGGVQAEHGRKVADGRRQWQTVKSPIGPLTLQPAELPASIAGKGRERQGKRGEGGEKGGSEDRALPYIKDPFASYQGSPVSLLSHGSGSVFSTREDHQRTIRWLELNWLLRESALALPDASLSRLSFAPTDLAFLYTSELPAALARNYVWLGRQPLVVDEQSQAMARLDLSTANLSAARHTDLLSLKFAFSAMFLVIGDARFGRGRPSLLPEGPLCGIYERRTVERNSNERESDQDRQKERLPVFENVDSRPLLIVEFPPQHIMEEAFFRPALPQSPDVDLSNLDEVKLKPYLHCGLSSSQQYKVLPCETQYESYSSAEIETLQHIVDIREADQIIEALRRITSRAARKTLRDQIQKKKQEADKVEGASVHLMGQVSLFKRYASDFTTVARTVLAKSAKQPKDHPQTVYVGPFAMDPDVAAANRELRAKLKEVLVRDIISDAFDEAEFILNRLTLRVAATGITECEKHTDRLSATVCRRGPGKSNSRQDLLAVEEYLESQVPLYQLFRNFYRDHSLKNVFPGNGNEADELDKIEFIFLPFDSNKLRKEKWDADAGFQPFKDTHLATQVEKKFARDVLIRFASLAGGTEEYAPFSRGRLSNPSRLSFRVNCRDGLVDARNAASTPRSSEKAGNSNGNTGQLGYQPGNPFVHGVEFLPFTLAGLTDWSSMELSVVERAERVFAGGAGGRLDQNSGRKINLHGAAMLDHLGFAPDGDPETRKWHVRAGHIAGSLRKPPGWQHTALELPSRLVLSPSQQAVFKAPNGVNPAIFEQDLQKVDPADFDRFGQPDTRARPISIISDETQHPTLLWSASLLTGADLPAPDVRAVYSPDLAPDAVLKLFGDNNKILGKGQDKRSVPGFGPPPRGPMAPWLLGRAQTSRADIPPDDFARTVNKNLNDPELKAAVEKAEQDDICEQDPQTLEWKFAGKLPLMFQDLCRRWKARNNTPEDIWKYRTSLDAYDRHELVMLSSAFGLPAMPRESSTGVHETTQQSGQFKPDEEYILRDVMPEQEIYRPRALSVNELTLTSLGANFGHDTSFAPPASAKFYDGRNLFDALSIERWQHQTSLGRDIYCEVVYKGFLCPYGFRASLVKVTERVFDKRSPDGSIKAYLRQRMFIRCADKEKVFGAIGQPNEGRRFPARFVRLLTDVTPDIVDPTDIGRSSWPSDKPLVVEHANGRIAFRDAPGLVFWPRTAMARRADIRFALEIEDAFTTLPLIFVDNVAANDPGTLKTLARYYNNELGDDARGVGIQSPDLGDAETAIDLIEHRRTMLMDGRKVRYADEMKAGSASLNTYSLTLRMEGRERGKAEPVTSGEGVIHYSFSNIGYSFDPVLQGADQPPFYPALETARVLLTQNAQLTGKPAAPVRATYDGAYVGIGFTDEKGAPGIQDEVFLNLLDAVSQDIGSQGDRSGGLYRPNGKLRAISRSKGPIALPHAVTKTQVLSGKLPALSLMLSLDKIEAATAKNRISAAEAGGKTPNSEQQKKKLRNILDECSLFGMITFGDIVDTITKLSSENIPEVLETVQYGVATKAASTIEESLVLVQREVIAPLSDLVTDADRRWRQLDAKLQERQQNRLLNAGNIEPVTLKELFPEIDKSLAEFGKALRVASAETNPGALLDQLSTLYETGQRFLDALRRAASNPVERFEAALERRVTELKEKIERVLRAALGQLDDFLTQVKAQIPKLIADTLLPGTDADTTKREVLFAIPLPASAGVFSLAAADRKKLSEALQVSRKEAHGVIADAVRAAVNDDDDAEEAFKTAVTKLLEEKAEAIKSVLDEHAANEFERLKDQLEVIKDHFELVAAGALDKLIKKVGSAIKPEHVNEFIILYNEVRALYTHYKNSETLWKQVELNVRSKNYRASLTSTTQLLSHVLGQDISIDPAAKYEEVLRQKIADVLQQIDFTKIGLVSLKKHNKESCAFQKGETPSNPELEFQFGSLKFDNSSVGRTQYLQDIANAHDEIVSVFEEFDAARNDLKDKLTNDDIPDAARKFLKAPIKNVDNLLQAAHDAVGGLYCDLVNDASLLAGLNKRSSELAQQLGMETAGNLTGDEFALLRSELKRLLAARKLTLRRTVQRAEKLLKAILDVMNGETALITGVAGFIGTLKLTGWDEQIKKGATEGITDLGNLVARLAGSLIGAAATIQNGASETLKTVVTFVNSIAPSGGNAEIVRLIRLDDTIVNKVKALNHLQSTLDNLGTNIDVVLRALPGQPADLEALEASFKAISAYFQKEEAGPLAPIRELQKTTLLEFEECLDVTRIAERAAKAVKTEFETRFREVADVQAALVIEKSGILKAYKELKTVRDKVSGSFESLVLLPPEPEDVRLERPGDPGKVPGVPLTKQNDRLAADVIWIEALIDKTGSVDPISNSEKRKYLRTFVEEWASGQSTPTLLIKGIGDQVRAVLRGDVDLDELFNIRQQIEAKLLNLLPTKHRFDLDFDFPLPEDVKDATGGIFRPGRDCNLSVGASTIIDLLPNGIPKGEDEFKPRVSAKALATLGSFEIKLIGEYFDAVTLKFGGARFVSDLGSNNDLKLAFEDFEIGKELEFIQDLQSFMAPSEGSGAFIQPLRGGRGIEAGYGLSLGTIMIGNVAFSNISLNASAELPFDGKSEARFKSSLSRRRAPFTIAYIPYGGSGYFSITANARGIVGFEMSLEFGGAAPFTFGLLSGQGRIMAGFYIRKLKTPEFSVTEISATFFAGGSANIWIFNFCASLYVRLGQIEGKMFGLAVFTFSFSMGLADFDFSIEFMKQEEKGFEGDGSGASLQGDNGATLFGSYLGDRANEIRVAGDGPVDMDANTAVIETKALCQSCNWKEYSAYFNDYDFEGKLP